MPDTRTVHILKALADETRLEIVRSIARKDCEQSCSSVSTCSELSQPALSHHFRKLVEAGVISEEKRGKEKFYCINESLLDSAGINVKKL